MKCGRNLRCGSVVGHLSGHEAFLTARPTFPGAAVRCRLSRFRTWRR
ncbi:hypothetical protein STRTUCAR8_05956, partial [Streptomyces turgidiscabies Car8]